MRISYFHFADDMIIFYNANIGQAGYLRYMLRCFEAVLGLKVNLAKIEILSVGEGPRC